MRIGWTGLSAFLAAMAIVWAATITSEGQAPAAGRGQAAAPQRAAPAAGAQGEQRRGPGPRPRMHGPKRASRISMGSGRRLAPRTGISRRIRPRQDLTT